MQEILKLDVVPRAKVTDRSLEPLSINAISAAEPADTKITLPESSRKGVSLFPPIFSDPQVEMSFSVESRKFRIPVRCVCGFQAVLVRAYHNYKEYWKVTCTKIRCNQETYPCSSREEAVRAWILAMKLLQ